MPRRTDKQIADDNRAERTQREALAQEKAIFKLGPTKAQTATQHRGLNLLRETLMMQNWKKLQSLDREERFNAIQDMAIELWPHHAKTCMALVRLHAKLNTDTRTTIKRYNQRKVS